MAMTPMRVSLDDVPPERRAAVAKEAEAARVAAAYKALPMHRDATDEEKVAARRAGADAYCAVIGRASK